MIKAISKTVSAENQTLQVPQAYSNLKLWQYQALQMKFEDPKMKQKDIAATLEKTEPQICEFFKTDRYKNAVVEYGKQRLFTLIPRAFKSIEESLDSENAHAKLNAALKILEDSGVLTKETITRMFKQINTQINIAAVDLKQKTAVELGEMLLDQIRGLKRA